MQPTAPAEIMSAATDAWPLGRQPISGGRYTVAQSVMSIEVGTLEHDDVDRASQLLSRAFAADPIITFYLRGRRRKIAVPLFFAAVLEQMLPSGHVYVARVNGRLVGAAAWLPPDIVEPPDSAKRRAQRHQQHVQRLFPRTSRDLYAGFSALEEFHPTEPHWYLAFVGVEPSRQSRGLGRALLEPALRLADAACCCCYLETPFPLTHVFYERLGFARQAEHNPFPGAPQGVVTFLRKPRSATQASS
jgi:GNAT superfamily N-acetyltransferase